MTSEWSARAVSPDEAVAGIRSGMRVFVHGAAATPTTLLEALARRTDLEGVTVYHLHTAGPAPFADPDKVGQFRSVSLFTGAPLRGADRRGPGRLRPDLPVGHPGPVPVGPGEARRGAAVAVGAGPPRLLHARHLGRRRAGGRRHGAAAHRGGQHADAAHAWQRRRADEPPRRIHRQRPAVARASRRRRKPPSRPPSAS